MVETAESRAEKNKDYRNVVIAQAIIIVMYFTSKDVLSILHFDTVLKYLNLILLALAGGYAFLLWKLIQNFTQNKWLIYGVLGTLGVLYVFAIITENPFFRIVDNPLPYFVAIHTVLMCIESLAIYYAIVDLFKDKIFSTAKIWGSACIYLTIGMAFANLYDLINMLDNNSLGSKLNPGFESYIESIHYSMSILGGVETGRNPIKLIRSCSLIENLWANLYLVLLIGRLIGLPENTKDSE